MHAPIWPAMSSASSFSAVSCLMLSVLPRCRDSRRRSPRLPRAITETQHPAGVRHRVLGADGLQLALWYAPVVLTSTSAEVSGRERPRRSDAMRWRRRRRRRKLTCARHRRNATVLSASLRPPARHRARRCTQVRCCRRLHTAFFSWCCFCGPSNSSRGPQRHVAGVRIDGRVRIVEHV